jgi:FkbM family methyltransferase
MLRLARTGGRVLAFEPHPECFQIIQTISHSLKREVLQSGCDGSGQYAYAKLPGAHGSFDDMDATIGASFTDGVLNPSEYEVRQDDVRCIDLDGFVRGLGKRVRALKLDIEGSEVPVLNRLLDTGTISLIDLVIAETHERLSPKLSVATEALRKRIEIAGLQETIRLDLY